LLIERIAVMGLIPPAEAAGICRQTARKWLLRFQHGGADALRDRTSPPDRTRSTIDAKLGERIELLRRARMPMRRIASLVGRSVATISRPIVRVGEDMACARQPAPKRTCAEWRASGGWERLH
jgi:hypothetical protein